MNSKTLFGVWVVTGFALAIGYSMIPGNPLTESLSSRVIRVPAVSAPCITSPTTTNLPKKSVPPTTYPPTTTRIASPTYPSRTTYTPSSATYPPTTYISQPTYPPATTYIPSMTTAQSSRNGGCCKGNEIQNQNVCDEQISSLGCSRVYCDWSC